MTEEPVDPRLEKLVASLYNELSAEEERALRLEIESDPALRAEWEELKATRSLFGTLEMEEDVPSFVLVNPAGDDISRKRAGGFGERFTNMWAWGGWAVAAAAVLFVLLGAGGLRVQKVENGFAVQFGKSPSVPLQVPSPTESVTEENAAPKSLAGNTSTREPANGNVETVALNPNASYLTEAEFKTRSDEMMKMVVALLNDHRSRRDEQMAGMLQAVYGQLNDRQLSDYTELRGRIDAVGLGLRAEQDRTQDFIETLLEAVDSTAVPAVNTEDKK